MKGETLNFQPQVNKSGDLSEDYGLQRCITYSNAVREQILKRFHHKKEMATMGWDRDHFAIDTCI